MVAGRASDCVTQRTRANDLQPGPEEYRFIKTKKHMATTALVPRLVAVLQLATQLSPLGSHLDVLWLVVLLLHATGTSLLRSRELLS